MTGTPLWQAVFGIVAVVTPWAVALTGRLMLHPPKLGDRIRRSEGARRLNVATAVAVAALAVAGLTMPPRALGTGLADAIAFMLLSAVAWPVLVDLDRASRDDRLIDSPLRIAFVRPRRVGEYASLLWRAVAIVVSASGVAAMAARLLQPAIAGRRLLIPVAFVLIAPLLAILHEVWLRHVVSGESIAEGEDLDREIRRDATIIQRWEVALVVSFVALGHLLLDVNWIANPGVAVSAALAGVVLGIAGCARLVASDLTSRKYRMVLTDDRVARSGR